MRIYIKEGDNNCHGLTQDVSEHIGTDNEIICTIGELNIFYINECISLRDVRIIQCGKNTTTFICWKQGTEQENSIEISFPTKMLETIKCGAHYHSNYYKVDMSQY